MAARTASQRKGAGRFLPAGATDMLKQWSLQAGGLALVALALALAAALATYDRTDPSLDTAAAPVGVVNNMLGTGGALFADLFLQLFGLTAWFPVLAITVWGGRLLVSGRPLERMWLRGLLLLSGLLLTAIGVAAIPLPERWHLPGVIGGSSDTLGGSAGKLLFEGLGEAAKLVGGSFLDGPLAIFCALLGLICTVYAFGLSFDEWRSLWRGFRAGLASLHRLQLAVSGLRGRLRPVDEVESAAPRNPPQTRGEPKFRRTEPEAAQAGRTEPVVTERAPTGPSPEPLVAPRAPRTQPGRREEDARQGRLDLPPADGYEPPPLQLLALPPTEGRVDSINEDGLSQNARLLESVLDDFGVNGEIVKVRPGPVVTLYELEPAPGTKTSRVIGLADDIARSMSALSVRIATVPGRSVIGIELPNSRRETVFLRELLASEAFERAPARLTLVLGKDISGQPVMVDLARMPHLLIAGTTGSGKSVAINTMILSLLYRLRPEECRLIMIDPKMLELSVYDGIPHLLAPVVTEPGKAVVALKWAVREMEDRYRAMSQLGVRNIAGYNQRLAEARQKGESLSRTVQTGFDPDTGKPVYEDQELDLKPLPFIVVVVDEMADLMLVAGKDIEAAIQRLAQMARAAGIHVIMATQRPSVDVITGTIKANFPTRISFQVSSKIDSRTILGEQGAEQLLGQGDMLYMAAGGRITRVHGPFVSDQEVEAVVEHLRQQGEPLYVEGVTEEEDGGGGDDLSGGRGDSGDNLYDQAVALVAREGKASTSFIQRHLQIGYNRAARIIEKMEAEGVVSRANHVGKREVLVHSHGD
ncbi:DNA translocase FtsK 4TM domain-containing protein [Telmatospirillum sp.]|uniref:FtsK/SpoIIIE family DNA translocase n=1 Tax=Telmatospirillum sp. TaxID=2079197 RepID=UPI0028400426|nr:DNA translocase FtsK 4TM domain-containing protein [Telmatospirillum sp.]MDR3439578.1 DNA translocase FtsK 4TM domain-containing protein [Telmatospirillum sp.]